MTKLTLEKLAKHWITCSVGSCVFPDSYAPKMTAQQANDLGEDILSLLNKIERLESIVLKNNDS